MREFELKQEVIIRQNGLKGRILGIWLSAYAEPHYNVRFFDQTDRPGDFWFAAEEIRAIIVKANPIDSEQVMPTEYPLHSSPSVSSPGDS